MLSGKVLPSGQYAQVIHVKSGDSVRLSVELSNTAYGSVGDLVVKVRMGKYGAGCWRIRAATRSSTYPGGNMTFDPALAVWASSQPSRLTYHRGSTELFDENGHLLARLGDGVAADGVPIPYAVPGGATWWVNFEVDVA